MLTQHTVRLKLADADPKSLGVSRLAVAPVTCAEGLVEGTDYEIERPHGTVRRLREFGRELYTFTMQYDDQSEILIAEETARTGDRTAAQDAIAALMTYRDRTAPTAAQTTACVKLLAGMAIILIRRAL